MGKRGPAPESPEVLRMKGSWRAKTRQGAPQPKRGRPKCPSFLSPAAKTKWRQIVPVLDQMGVLTTADGDVLSAYCQAWAEFQIATETLDREGRTVTLPSGAAAAHPCVQQQRS